MELVYLWVEKYKNIENQGFNFSPRFECEFFPEYEKDADGKKKLKDNCELVIKPKEHIENFFGKKNINVTAIVGENGSGKSNILDLIFNEHITTSVFFILRINTELKIYGIDLDSSKYPNNTIREEQFQNKVFKCSNLQSGRLNNYKLAFYTPLMQDSFTDNKHNYKDKKINLSPASLLDDYINNQQIYKNITFKNLYSIYESNSIQNSIDMMKNCKNLKLPFDIPTELTIRVNMIANYEEYLEQYNFLKDKNKSEDSFYGYVEQRAIKNWFHNSFQGFYQRDISFTKPILEEVKKVFGDTYSINNLIEKFPIQATAANNKSNGIDFLHQELQVIKEFLDLVKTIPNGIKDNSLKLKIENIPDNFISEYNKVIATCSVFLEFSWKPQLSSGQQTFLSQFSLFNKYLNNNEKTLLLIDEGETTLHPNWQKRYVKYIIDFFKDNIESKKLHVIFSSHSPFILSDLPKDNVIFLEKYSNDNEEVRKNIQKVGNCKNNTKDIKINPFGANIHTLLSHGFFMKDGLMGEFAKGKINNIIEFHKKVEQQKEDKTKKEELKTEYEKKKKEFWHIQSIIGEDYLKQVIKNHLVEIEKLLLGKDEARKTEIARLQKQIDLLEKEND